MLVFQRNGNIARETISIVISYLGEDKQKEGGGNKLQRTGSVIYSFLVQVGFMLLALLRFEPCGRLTLQLIVLLSVICNGVLLLCSS